MSNNCIAVIDYGMGNLHSVASALRHVAPDAEIVVTADAKLILAAQRVVFPGVGAIGACLSEIHRFGLEPVVAEVINSGRPLLSICVAMQVLMQHSEENGGVDCLGVLPGDVRFFGNHLRDEYGDPVKVPHMGWNQVQQTMDHPLWQGIEQGSRFYFVHSFYVAATDLSQVAGQCCYVERFAAALSKANVFAVQFHPEKSHTAGLQLLRNFTTWNGRV